MWGTDLSALTDGLGWLFARPEPKETFGLFVRAMLADVAKKNCWAMAELRAWRTRRSSSTC